MSEISRQEFDALVLAADAGDENAIQRLEPFRAKRAVFIAAGFGSRMVPITINTPKPLIKVKGQRIIDGLIDACIKAGIEEIYIVRGYLKEQFDQLLYKYPMIKFIDNDLYTEANNISSAFLARRLLRNAYVFEADLCISNPDIITKYHYSSDFLAIPVKESEDWCFDTKDGIITEEMVGGKDCHQMVGISYWSDCDGAKLEKHLEQAFSKEKKTQLYWEQVPLRDFKEDYSVAVRECSMSDIIELDTFKELMEFDDSYKVII